MEELVVRTIDAISHALRHAIRQHREEAGGKELFDLTLTQLHYLHAIRELGQPTFRDLVEKFQVQKSTVTALVNKLVQKGYVYKRQSAEDLRVYHIHLAPKGERLVHVEDEGYRYFARQITACLDEGERRQFTALLQKISAKVAPPGAPQAPPEAGGRKK